VFINVPSVPFSSYVYWFKKYRFLEQSIVIHYDPISEILIVPVAATGAC
jgi:hypothetical protein